MPNWKKVIVSGSNATLNQVTSSVVRADTNLKIPVYSSNPSAVISLPSEDFLPAKYSCTSVKTCSLCS